LPVEAISSLKLIARAFSMVAEQKTAGQAEAVFGIMKNT
jgi:hypothetical protein